MHDSAGLFNSGAAFVFERVGSNWVERAMLSAADADTGDFFGSDVALDSDTVLVGAEWEGDGAQQNYGAAYVFVRNGTSWTQQAKLVAPQRAHNSLFGRSLALSGDTAVIGALQDSSVSSVAGSVDVFVRNGTTWTHQTHLAVTDAGIQPAFGYDIAIDQNTLLVGAPFDSSMVPGGGSVYVFERAAVGWSNTAKFTATLPTADQRFGAAIALEGARAVIGTFALPGTAFVYERSGNVWTERAELTPADPNATAGFGLLVGLHGERVTVGAPLESGGFLGLAGAAYLFELDGADWKRTQRLLSPSPANDDSFGVVALHGTTLAVGELRDGVNNVGAVHIYEFGALDSYCTAGTSTHGCTPHLLLDGTPSATGNTPANLAAHGVRGQSSGLVFVGANASATPWAAGSSSVLCIAPPLARLPPEVGTGGTLGVCDGVLRSDINGHVSAHGGSLLGQSVFAGTTVRAQAWYRDPPAPNFGNLSDALSFTFYP